MIGRAAFPGLVFLLFCGMATSQVDRRPEERAAFINEACADDEGLRCEVGSLLARHGFAVRHVERTVRLDTSSFPDDVTETRILPGAKLDKNGVAWNRADDIHSVRRAAGDGRLTDIDILPTE